jgi:acyl-CoA reductase-like NAD-dependent aldehyde dehydrogenase
MSDSPGRLRLDNPYTLEQELDLPLLDASDIDPLLDAARRAAADLAGMPLERRVALCDQAIAAMMENIEGIAADITRTMGKPLRRGLRFVAWLRARST